MKRVLATALLAGVAVVALSATSYAAGTNVRAKIMLHNLPVTTKTPCNRTGANTNLKTDCSGYDAGTHTTAGSFSFAYLLVVNGGVLTGPSYDISGGIAGAQCGIQYANDGDGVGVDVYSWTLCATLEFITPGSPLWPQSGGGDLITWNATGPQCTAPPGNATIGALGVGGYFYIGSYSPSQMRVIPRPVDGVAKVANCGSQEDVVQGGDDAHTFLGALGIAGGPAINPCGRDLPVAVEKATWSGVKALVKS